MFDFLGREITVNQYVVFSNTEGARLELGLVTGFSTEKVKIRVWRSQWKNTEVYKLANNLCIISEEDAIMYVMRK